MRRIFALFMAVILTFSVIVSCGYNKKVEPITDLPNEYYDLYLVPYIMTKDRYENVILASIDNEDDAETLKSFYKLYDLEAEGLTKTDIELMIFQVPACEKRAVYVCDPSIMRKEALVLEEIIKEHCLDYTHEMMAADYLLCGYTVDDALKGLIPQLKGSIDAEN